MTSDYNDVNHVTRASQVCWQVRACKGSERQRAAAGERRFNSLNTNSTYSNDFLCDPITIFKWTVAQLFVAENEESTSSRACVKAARCLNGLLFR
jgi:hypothetical protein